MNAQEPAITFNELVAYSDYISQRWLDYFKQNPGALDVDVGGKTGSIRDLVTHIFQVEQFFTDLLAVEGKGSSAPPPKMEAPKLEDLERMHQQTQQKLLQYVASANEEVLAKTRKLGAGTFSNRKILAQTALHGVHHWAQVAMEVRQAGFPPNKAQDIIGWPMMK